MQLQINEVKTKYIYEIWTNDEILQDNQLIMEMEDGKVYNFEEVRCCRYLGVVFGKEPETKDEIKARLMTAS